MELVELEVELLDFLLDRTGSAACVGAVILGVGDGAGEGIALGAICASGESFVIGVL